MRTSSRGCRRSGHGVVCLLLGTVGLLHISMAQAQAQELEPRAYSNLPRGLNFLPAGYRHSQGGLSTNPSLPLRDAHLKIDTGVFSCVRGLGLWGRSGKFDLVAPYSRLSGSALAAGQPRERDVSGFGDPRARLSINFYGAPSLSLRQYPA